MVWFEFMDIKRFKNLLAFSKKIKMVIQIDHEKREPEINSLKSFWNWLWNSDSWLSYLVFLLVVFVFVKFIFLPGLGFVFQTSLPMAIVESSSMDHYALQVPGIQGNSICGKTFEDSQFLNEQEYWNVCGEWYEQNTNITKEQFESFKFNNGFRKGDLMIIFGKKISEIKVGDTLIFNAGRSNPIIHRVVSVNPLQTKGDHNSAQLLEEQNINSNQIIGVAVARIPYIGWIKLFFVEIFRKMIS
jgi:signal peptidase I